MRHKISKNIAIFIRNFRSVASCNKQGSPVTDLNALTGELTPPGKSVFDFLNNFSDLTLLILSTNCILSIFTQK